MLQELDRDQLWVKSDINYIRNPPAPGEPSLTFVTEDESQSTMRTLPGVTMPIYDLRGVKTSLAEEGFELVSHTSKVADFHLIEEDPATDQLYIDEMTELLKRLTGAKMVIMQGGGKKRYGKSAQDRLTGLKNALPALYPHGDTTDRSALYMAKLISSYLPDVEFDNVKHWALYNMWRPITPPPHDYGLAVCDVRTVAPDDKVPVLAKTETRQTGALDMETSGYLYNPEHRWFAPRNMTPQEVLVFTTHESDPARAHQVAHSAFPNPDCPPDAPARGSVEMRAFVIFD